MLMEHLVHTLEQINETMHGQSQEMTIYSMKHRREIITIIGWYSLPECLSIWPFAEVLGVVK